VSFITSPSPEDETSIISNSQFWPDIDISVLRSAIRLDGTVTEPRLIHAVINAIAWVNQDLADWRKEQQAIGITSLANVEAEQINHESILIQHYLRAVYAMTKANLIEHYRDFDSTGDGHKAADKLELSADDLYRDARFAIRDIIGQSHTTVELI
jgi:hypothetical protein